MASQPPQYVFLGCLLVFVLPTLSHEFLSIVHDRLEFLLYLDVDGLGSYFLKPI